jgi:deoxyribose-phosphate aldolase
LSLSTGYVPLTKAELAKRIDHTCLKPNSTSYDIDRLCDEAIKFDFWAVCVSPYFVKQASLGLLKSDVKVCVVVGFPFGSSLAEAKLNEAQLAIQQGADEVDMVMNVSAFKSRDYDTVLHEVELVADFCRANGKLLKVIVECCYLGDDEKALAARMVEHAGAHFVKTSTGFGMSGATARDVGLLKSALSGRAKVKAAGGIGTLDKALEMIRAGADRIGTSSGAKIMGEWADEFDR